MLSRMESTAVSVLAGEADEWGGVKGSIRLVPEQRLRVHRREGPLNLLRSAGL
jgi:hypothetical protein